MESKNFYCCLFCYHTSKTRTKIIAPLFYFNDDKEKNKCLLLTPFLCCNNNGHTEKFCFPLFPTFVEANSRTLKTTKLGFCLFYITKDGPDETCYTPLGFCTNDCEKGCSPCLCCMFDYMKKPVPVCISPLGYCDGNGNCYPYNCKCEYTSSDTVKMNSDIETYIAKTEDVKQRYNIEWLCGSFNKTKIPPPPEFVASLHQKKRELERINTNTVIHSRLRNHDEHNIGALIRQYME